MPVYWFEFETPYSPDAAIERVRSITAEPPSSLEYIRRAWRFETSSQPFLGEVEDYSFRIRRDISYRNSFLPQIRGTVTSTPAGSKISVKMFVHPAAGIFMLIWLGGTALVTLNTLVGSHPKSASGSFVPLGMFLFGLFLSCGGFFPEALKARRLLEAAINHQGLDE